MFSHLLKSALRNILKKKSFSLINIVGLSVGLTVFFLLFLYVKYEYSYDDFLPNSANVYRIELEQFQDNDSQFDKATSTYAIGPLLKEQFPAVEEYARAGFEKCLVFRNEVKYNDQELFWVDSTFLNVIEVEMLQGNRTEALQAPYSVVLSEDLAHVYFGNEDPMGQIIFINEQLPFTVKGVFKTLPTNSHFNFKLLLSLSTGNVLWPGWGTNNRSWGGHEWLYTYLRLSPGTDTELLSKQIEQLVAEQLPEQMKGANIEQHYNLRNIRDIHLQSNLQNEFKVNGSATNVRILMLIGLLIIVIAWINFINIASSEAFDKAREVGVRKVNGANKRDIIAQFMVEVFILNCISALLTMGLVFIALPFFQSVINLPLYRFFLDKSEFIGILLLMSLLGTLFSGLYPALILSSFQIQKVLKGKVLVGNERFSFKKILVVFQLTVTIGLIIAVLIIFKQLNFIQTKELGFKKELVMVINAPSSMNMSPDKLMKYRTFKDRLTKNGQIVDVASTAWSVGQECLGEWTINSIDGKEINHLTLKINQIDESYLNVYGLKLLAGKVFDYQERDFANQVLINATAVRQMGYAKPEDAVGRIVRDGNNNSNTVIGVIADFHQESLRQRIRPMVFAYQHPANFGQYAVLMKSEQLGSVVQYIETQWNSTYTNAPFDYHFLDEQLNHLYTPDQRFGKLLFAFTILAILIACLGLLSLVMILSRKNIKQVGIRKVNGAQTGQIMLLLNLDLLKWFAFSMFIAGPVAGWLMKNWLAGFAYQTNMSWWIFALAGVLTLCIVLLTVSWQSWRAATRNPVEALRYE